MKLEFVKKEMLSIDLQTGVMRGEAFRKRLRHTEKVWASQSGARLLLLYNCHICNFGRF